jgi:serine/threonine protein phosphatase PrpC
MNQSAHTQQIIGEKMLVQAFETLQLGSKQDYCAQGSYVNRDGKQVYWSAAFDGHGGQDAIKIIRKVNMGEIMANDRPEVQLQRCIDETMNHDIMSREYYRGEIYRSGSTMVLGKATFCESYTEIEITNVGDSSGILYINGEPVFVTKEHNHENGEEMIRLISEGRVDKESPLIKSNRAIDVFSRNKLYSKKGVYINFVAPNGDNMVLSPSQSLGHMGICGLSPTITVFRVLPTDDFKLVLCSDGVTDVMPVNGVGSAVWLKLMATSSATEIVDIAESQWKREWGVSLERIDKTRDDGSEYYDFTVTSKTRFPRGGYDDSCCAVMEFRKASSLTLDPPPVNVITSLNLPLTNLNTAVTSNADAVAAVSRSESVAAANEDEDEENYDLYN